MLCKVLWLKENEPETYAGAKHICEYTEWLTHRLTGEWAASINTTSVHWYYDRNAGGFPASLHQAVGLDDLIEKFPQNSDDAAQATSAGILYALNTIDGSVLLQFTFPILSLLSSP